MKTLSTTRYFYRTVMQRSASAAQLRSLNGFVSAPRCNPCGALCPLIGVVCVWLCA